MTNITPVQEVDVTGASTRAESNLENSIQKTATSPRSAHTTTARVSSNRKFGHTAYGFPSTVNQGRSVKQVREKDREIENGMLVTKQNHMQTAIKIMRQDMADKGATQSKDESKNQENFM